MVSIAVRIGDVSSVSNVITWSNILFKKNAQVKLQTLVSIISPQPDEKHVFIMQWAKETGPHLKCCWNVILCWDSGDVILSFYVHQEVIENITVYACNKQEQSWNNRGHWELYIYLFISKSRCKALLQVVIVIINWSCCLFRHLCVCGMYGWYNTRYLAVSTTEFLLPITGCSC